VFVSLLHNIFVCCHHCKKNRYRYEAGGGKK
jgi:hypothetical protein